jgi:hypothetical protein
VQWEHPNDYDTKTFRNFISCQGDIEEIKATFKEKNTHKDLRRIFIRGEKPRPNNSAECIQFLCGIWLGKHRPKVGALEYDVQMKAAKLHANERFHFARDSAARTWREEIWHLVADAVGVGVHQLVSPQQLLAYRLQVRAASVQSKRRRKKAAKVKTNARRGVKRTDDAGETEKSSRHYAPPDWKATGTEWNPSESEEPLPKRQKTARCKCNVQTDPEHFRTNSKLCPLNKKNLNLCFCLLFFKYLPCRVLLHYTL